MRFTVGLLVTVGVMYFIMACVSIAFVFLPETEAEADVYINPIRYEYASQNFVTGRVEAATFWMNSRAMEGYKYRESIAHDNNTVTFIMEKAIIK